MLSSMYIQQNPAKPCKKKSMQKTKTMQKKQNPCTECCDVSGRCALTASLTHSGVSLLRFPLIPPQRQPPTSTLKDPKAGLHNVKYKYKIAESPLFSTPASRRPLPHTLNEPHQGCINVKYFTSDEIETGLPIPTLFL